MASSGRWAVLSNFGEVLETFTTRKAAQKYARSVARVVGTKTKVKDLGLRKTNPSGTFEARAKRAIKKGEKFLVSVPSRIRRGIRAGSHLRKRRKR